MENTNTGNLKIGATQQLEDPKPARPTRPSSNLAYIYRNDTL